MQDKINIYKQMIILLKEYVKPIVLDDEKPEEIKEILEKVLKENHFYENFTNLLKGKVKSKSEAVINGEDFCDSLKKILADFFEETHKLDVFSDEFNLRDFLREHIDRPIERMKEQMEKTWLQDKLTIGLIGHFCTGKTTALNLMFGESFKTNEHENTALTTYLTYGLNTNIVTIVDKAGQSQELTLEQCCLFDYRNEVEDFPFARIFNYMVKENKNEILKDLTIIDTPGLFSPHIDHSNPIKNVIANCDVIFWFINITDSASHDDYDKIKKYVGSLPLYIVFSYVDARSTTPQEVDESIKDILQNVKKNEIICNGFLKLGKRDAVRQQFKAEASLVLKKLIYEHEAYVPLAHILGTINDLEEFLVKWKNYFVETITNLDAKTDKLFDEYQSSCRSFYTECNNSQSRFDNMVQTFENRCIGAAFCGGASGALCNNINSIYESFDSMNSAYKNMDFSKLVEYGDGIAKKEMYQYKLDRVSKILSNLIQLKNQLL